jgi:glycosyltransferase involved in cell wall biosynthesis
MNVRNPKVSVLMPVYNGEKYLQEAIESILNQTFRDFEFLIISEYGTSEESLAIINSYSDERIRHIHNTTRLGLVRSLNLGLREARGEYIARMDADDISFSNRFERQIYFMEQTHRVAVVGGVFVKISEDGTPTGIVRYPAQDRDIKKDLAKYCCIAHPTAFIRKKAINKVGGYREVVIDAEDYDLWLRLADCYELANLEYPILYLRTHGNQASVNKIKQQVVSSLGAQVSAKIRSKTGCDPLDEIERVTIDFLYCMGLQDKIIQEKIIDAQMWWAENMILAGDKTSTIQLLNEARKIAHSHENYKLKSLVANGYLRLARLLYKQKKYRGSHVFLIEAICLNPTIILREIKKKLALNNKRMI